jgi:hypothetical protein
MWEKEEKVIENHSKRRFVTCNHGGRSRRIEKERRELEEEERNEKSLEELLLGLKKGQKRYETETETEPNAALLDFIVWAESLWPMFAHLILPVIITSPPSQTIKSQN